MSLKTRVKTLEKAVNVSKQEPRLVIMECEGTEKLYKGDERQRCIDILKEEMWHKTKGKLPFLTIVMPSSREGIEECLKKVITIDESEGAWAS